MIMLNLQEENSASIEWISLYLVLNEKWLEFSVLEYHLRILISSNK